MTGGVIVMGMRRSGTSLSARLLFELGYYVENNSRPPDRNNVEGYWESKKIQDLNTGLLHRLGGTPEVPPVLVDGWEENSKLDRMRRRAKSIMTRYSRHQPWGMKDDRFSITLPFWKPLLPSGTSYLICVRNPVGVLLSWKDMQRVNRATALNTWFHYVSQALKNTRGEKRLIVHYEDFAQTGGEAIARLCDFLGKDFDPGLQAIIKPGMFHHRPSIEDLLETAEASNEVKSLYSVLLAAKSDPSEFDRLPKSLDVLGKTPPR